MMNSSFVWSGRTLAMHMTQKIITTERMSLQVKSRNQTQCEVLIVYIYNVITYDYTSPHIFYWKKNQFSLLFKTYFLYSIPVSMLRIDK